MARVGSAGSRRFKGKYLAAAALAAMAAAGVALPDAALAQQSGAERSYDFDLPSQPLARSVSQVASKAGLQVLFDGTDSTEITVPAVKGRMSAEAALTRILAGSGLTYQYVRPGVITLRRASAEGNDGELVTGAVQVEGVQGSPYFGGAGQAAGVNGINGSRDITATEGTGSFTSGALTIGSKVPQALKDVPQSISVLTSERLEQQNVTDFSAAMKQLPGVTLVQGDNSLRNTFYSRGFEISSIQVDGGAPFSTNFNYQPQIDMAQYDHVELLRGADGQFGAYGQPSGSVNLVRKKPLDHAQFALELQAGSWSNYRLVMDATSPLALDGKLRGRLVTTYQDNHYFYDTAKDNKTLIYAIAEFDATPTTLVTGGITYMRQNSLPWLGGLPRYQTGADLMLSRSTSLAFPWNRQNLDTTEIFGGMEQKIGADWTLKLNLTHNRQVSTEKYGQSYGAVNPNNGLGPFLYGSYADYASKQLSAEATLIGSFSLFGQRQEVTIGVNRANTDGGGYISYNDPIATSLTPYQPYPGGPIYCQNYGSDACPTGSIPTNPPVDVFHFDPNDPLYAEPRNPLANARFDEYGEVQTGAYINLRLTAFDRLHLTTGLRWSKYERKNSISYLCSTTSGDCAGKAIGDAYDFSDTPYGDTDFSWPPPVSLSFDITRQLTAYAGYTDIYQSQASALSADLTPLAPVTGGNWEGGLKWGARDGKLNISLAAYRIKQRGFGAFDDSVPYREVSPGIYCCYVPDPNGTLKSEGIDLEIAGELRPGWQIAASYTYNRNKQEGSSFGSTEGLPIVSISPRHLYKLWMSYDFEAAGLAGWPSRLSVSGGINGQSSAYRSGGVCVNLDPLTPPDPLTGYQPCKSYVAPDYVQYSFVVPPYAVISGRIDYRFSGTWSLAINLENIFDKTYYQTVSKYPDSGNWYGAPRSVTATLRAKW